MLTSRLQLQNPSGLHARPASKLCAISKKFSADCYLASEDKEVNLKKILDLMAANFQQGVWLEIKCSGIDEQEALDSISRFIHELRE